MTARPPIGRAALLLAAALLASAAPDAAGAPAAAPPPALRHRAEFPLAGIVGLENDRFLLWHSTGEMQVGTAAGAWTPVFRTASRPVSDIAAGGNGFFAAASVDNGMSVVVLLDSTGRERSRWTLKQQVFRILGDDRARFVTTRAGVVPLLAGGTLGPAAPYLEPPTPFHTPPPGPLAAPPDVLRFDSASSPATVIACRARDLSMASHAPGRCWKSGPSGWKLTGNFVTPMACGDWLVAVEGSRPAHVVVYSLASGKAEMTLTASAAPEIACAAPNELLVGDRRLSLYTLPGRKPSWAGKPLAAPIINVAAAESAFAYRLQGSLEVVIVPRPPLR